MGNIKNEAGKEGPKATAIKGNKNGLVLSKSLGSLSVVLISATPFQNVILLLTYYFGCMSVVSEGSDAVAFSLEVKGSVWQLEQLPSRSIAIIHSGTGQCLFSGSACSGYPS